ncbi:hypothetical protein [Neptunomonas japonica]|uniref:hypothetical protein n=1 Tax=Neptunomonas japonica TaxID=417574 RepID=UPI00040668A9|nr:hypothetical protein [Neptunomonas japonica]
MFKEIEFDPASFRECFWHFIKHTTLKEKLAAQALFELLEIKSVSSSVVNKALRKWFEEDGGISWKNPEYAYMCGMQKRDKACTFIQQLDFLVAAMLHRYSFNWHFQYSLTMNNDLKVELLAAVEPHYSCVIHSADAFKMVDPVAYVSTKPFADVFECKCLLNWAPASQRNQSSWKARIEKYKAERQNSR